jgi:methylphosphotriester-DNA--protein-cysteine methyltransferase
MITTVEDALRDGQRPPLPGTSTCERAIDLMRADPARRVEEVAASLDLSHGHLDRLFSRVVGLSPLGLSRILRMRRLLADLAPTGEVDSRRCGAR